MTKRVLSYHSLPTPPFQVFERPDEPLDPALTFPLFVKPSRQGTGMGISAQSIVHDEAQLRAQIQRLLEVYRESVLVERFISGRDVTVGIVSNLAPPVAWRIPERMRPRHASTAACVSSRRWRSNWVTMLRMRAGFTAIVPRLSWPTS